jgi:uncharacterized protein YjbI with pentapeptide repeats
MGTLLEKYNGSLTANPIINALARAKTLNVIRLIGVERSTRLIQFLFDAGQLTQGHNKQPLNLSGAILNRINMSVGNYLVSMNNVSLQGVHMNEATFTGQDLSNWNFTGASLNYANFTGSNCRKTIFDGSTMIQADFSHAQLDGASFRRTDLTGASFSHSRGEQCAFDSASLSNSIFYQAKMSSGNFHQVNFNQVNLEGAYISGSTLAFASLINARMNGIYLLFANLSYANMLGADCSESQCRLHDALSLLYAILPNGTNSTVIYRPVPLLRNWYANCSGGSTNDHVAGWKILGDPVFTTREYNSAKICVFAPQKGGVSSEISMSQRVNISLFRQLITNGHALLSMEAHHGLFTEIKMSEIDETGKISPVTRGVRYIIEPDTTVWKIHCRRTTVQIEIELILLIARVSSRAWFEYVDLTMLLWLP